MSIDQIFLMILGGISIYLANDRDQKVRRYACLFGLASQPFWFYSAYQAEQWGVFIISFWYAFAWARGAYYNWFAEGVA
jgi:hypothetical protein